MRANITSLADAANSRDVDLQIYFAHKANKWLPYAQQARQAGIGIDVASAAELLAAIESGFAGSDIAVTAAVKSTELIRQAIDAGATIVVDNADQWQRITESLIEDPQATATLVPRLRGFALDHGRHRSRFGFAADSVVSQIDQMMAASSECTDRIVINGLHFHFDGHTAMDRVAAILQSIVIAKQLRQSGHRIESIDIGGGFPVQYLQREEDWIEFHRRMDQSLGCVAADACTEPVLMDGQSYGRTRVSDSNSMVQTQRNYPTWQPQGAAEYLGRILDTPGLCARLRQAGLTLRCQPGRALLADCGMTIARVDSVVDDHSSDPAGRNERRRNVIVNLEMNRTNCSTTSVDFAVDPILLTVGRGERSERSQGVLAGCYCAEDDYITPRRFCFTPSPVPGDLFVFPNTAAYQMHFQESGAHQMPLPRNIASD
ncbi:L-glutamyl-[BtrI acyl-carrier protein] decarboxylase [Rubripirellula lacrimiformis]|uniref:L-glutamyl-[BtrI acyl-carrier protein] decarboxylase n=2 Tax=Rubripirellula lacrimiformis TaxID=1930273 RepID=A0A517NFI8_9BACT|nr:L-glutamyl-[BtrI acyl-carrier protein] decarboxylase [Rubripirellula lacrimiformis]